MEGGGKKEKGREEARRRGGRRQEGGEGEGEGKEGRREKMACLPMTSRLTVLSIGSGSERKVKGSKRTLV